MKVSQTGINLIAGFEGLRLDAYPDPGTGNEPITIGYGTTIYPNGIKVKMGDVITKSEALDYLQFEVEEKAITVSQLTLSITLNQNQFDALVSFSYNVGLGALKKSTLLKKVKADPNDPTIERAFLMWARAGGRVMAGLKRRRQAEADLYFT